MLLQNIFMQLILHYEHDLLAINQINLTYGLYHILLLETKERVHG